MSTDTDRALTAIAVSLMLALAILASLAFFSGSASAASKKGYKPCPSKSLDNQGVSFIHAKNASCKLARQVAAARYAGDNTPKGFACKIPHPYGNLTPYACSKGAKRVNFGITY